MPGIARPDRPGHPVLDRPSHREAGAQDPRRHLTTTTATTTGASTSSLARFAAGWLAPACVAWGALTFGAVYPWAYWPLAVACLACGLAGLFSTRVMPGTRAVGLALAAVALAGLVQLLPLPLAWHAWLSPSAAALLPRLDFFYGAGLSDYRALSVVPRATLTALALYGSFAILLLGLSRLMTAGGARPLAEKLAIFAVFLALAGIIQQPLYTGKIYGFWEPQMGGAPFGPFVNKNHFAGWMLMALPIVLALLCGGIERSMRGLKPGWHYRLLWLSSPEANRLILLAAGAAVLALSLVLTMSRSGISAMALSLLLTGWFIARGIRGGSRKTAGLTYLLLLTITVVGWIGADTIVTRFSKTDWTEFNGRRGAWADAWNVASSFPVAGTGINTYDTIATYYQRHDLQAHSGEAHNDYLQLAAEGGVLVGGATLICLMLFVREVWRRMNDDPGSTSWWLRRGAVTALVAIGLQETVDFSLQMPGNAVLFAVVCAMAIHRPPVRHASAPQRPRLIHTTRDTVPQPVVLQVLGPAVIGRSGHKPTA